MPSPVEPVRMTKDDLPAPARGGPAPDPRQRFINATLEAYADDIAKLDGTDDALTWTFSKSHDESFARTHLSAHSAKDSCRRAFRKGLKELDLDFKPAVQYAFDLEQLPKGEILCNGFTASVYAEVEE